uniref:BZIP domain-containing protein n=1 Tax=Macrostomum lignano TaxID=282301 RepID=A0A1I8FQZ9_9PLAT
MRRALHPAGPSVSARPAQSRCYADSTSCARSRATWAAARRCPRILLSPVSCLCGAQAISLPCPAVPGRPTAASSVRMQRPCGHPSLHELPPGWRALPALRLPDLQAVPMRPLSAPERYPATRPPSAAASSAAARCPAATAAPCCATPATARPPPRGSSSRPAKQPCRQARQDCGHPCMLPCHPSGAMQAAAAMPGAVTLRCPCSRRIQECRATSPLRWRNAGLHLTVGSGRRDDLQPHLISFTDTSNARLIASCRPAAAFSADAQSATLEKRNRQLAEALGVENRLQRRRRQRRLAAAPVNLAPVYARTLLDLWKAYPSFAVMVESRLDETCSAVVSGRSQSRSTQFPAPNRDGQKVTGAGSDASRTVTVTRSAAGPACRTGSCRPRPQRLFGIGGLQQQSGQHRLLPRAVPVVELRAGGHGQQLPADTLGRVATAYSRLPDQMDSMELGGSGGGCRQLSNSD